MMTQTNRWFIRAASVLAFSMLCSCGTTYTPAQSSVQKMSVEEARNIFKQLVKPPARFFELQGSGMLATFTTDKEISNVEIRTTSITVIIGKNKYKITLKDLEPSVIHYPGSAEKNFVYLNEHQGFFSADSNSTLHTDEQAAKRLVDALFVLKSAALSTRDEEAYFQEAARNYRASAIKPQLPEAVRRFRVQAESAIRDKDFDAAADFYEQALEVAPWWPEGHFNRALVLSETGEFPDAIVEMKRYLALVPDAPDALAAQDKIYDWERKSR